RAWLGRREVRALTLLALLRREKRADAVAGPRTAGVAAAATAAARGRRVGVRIGRPGIGIRHRIGRRRWVIAVAAVASAAAHGLVVRRGFLSVRVRAARDDRARSEREYRIERRATRDQNGLTSNLHRIILSRDQAE